MAETFQFETGQPRSSAPIVISISGAVSTTESEIKLHSEDGYQNDFTVGLKTRPDNSKFAEFILMRPGKYKVALNGVSQTFEVLEQRNVSFFTEITLLSILVFFILGGLIRWTRKKRSFN